METKPETVEQQGADPETVPAVAELEQAQVEPQDQPAPVVEQMIQVAPGVAVTLSQYRAAADIACRDCWGSGIITVTTKGKTHRVPCRCAARHILREMRKQMPPKEVATVTRDPAKARQRVEEHLAVLRTEVADIENDVDARMRGAKEAVESAESQVRIGAKLRQCSIEGVGRAQAAIDALKVEYELRLQALEQTRAEESELLAARERGLAQAQESHAQAQAKLARSDRDTEGARKRASNLRRRADIFEARNRDVLAEPPAPNATAAMEGQPDATG